MCHANDEKRKETNDRKNRTAKLRKNQNVRKKGNLQVLGNIGSRNHQASGDEIKKKEYQR